MIFAKESKKYDIANFESRVLLCTSSYAIVPIFYALHKRLIFHALVSTGNIIFSFLYWVHPIHGWRRDLDLFYAKSSFVFYFTNGVLHISPGYPLVIFGAGTSIIFGAYYLTFVYPNHWLKFHILFHLCSILMKLYILSFVYNCLSS